MEDGADGTAAHGAGGCDPGEDSGGRDEGESEGPLQIDTADPSLLPLPLPLPPSNAPSPDTHATPSPQSLHAADSGCLGPETELEVASPSDINGGGRADVDAEQEEEDQEKEKEEEEEQQEYNKAEEEEVEREQGCSALSPSDSASHASPSPSPSRVKLGEVSVLSSALLDTVLPMLATHKETLSTRPRALLQGVTHRAQQLVLELAVIKIQSQHRRLSSARRVARLRTYSRVLLALSLDAAADLVEKAAVAGSVSVAREVWEGHHAKDAREAAEEEEMLGAVQAVCLEACDPAIVDVVGEAIQEAVESYIKAKPKATTNPLVLVIERLMDEACRELSREVARAFIQDSVAAFLEMRHAVTGFEFVCRSLLEEDVGWAVALAEETLVGKQYSPAHRHTHQHTPTHNHTRIAFYSEPLPA